MTNLKDRANEKIDVAARAAKKATAKVVEKSKDVAHVAGQKLVDGGKRLKSV
jgi:hypothetical protein